jgi:hypothetical protein
MNKKDLTINLNIALSQIPEQYILEIVERIQASSVVLPSIARSNTYLLGKKLYLLL